ncbi:hypothetical protein [Aeromonas veronii]|uniref:hypothetical protein n=1 Tax=Aeromonas veronii TaxID=654 RepID=UPI0011171654|nr:hypothetical protein [Aeromonas veronii]TNI98272.1 hypothetical protein CF114_10265 [Aeromonas veronii]
MNVDLEKLLELAGKATPQHFDLAQMVTSDGLIECPCCSGSGEVELGNDYCNYDGAAIGVQFYGIGDAHVNAEEFYRAANPATVTELVNMVKGSTLACIADVQAEPEFPGDAPPELMKYIRQCIEEKDELHLLHMMRMAYPPPRRVFRSASPPAPGSPLTASLAAWFATSAVAASQSASSLTARAAPSAPTRSDPSIQMRGWKMGWIRRSTASTAPAYSAAASVASRLMRLCRLQSMG